MDEEKRVKVGVGVMILRDGKVLLGKRKGSHGEGEYSFPGGHLEFGESIKDCAIREVEEESGIKIKNIKFQFFANLIKYTGKHYAHIGIIAEWKSGEPEVLEPDKCGGWNWYELNNLPNPLFEPCRLTFENYKNGNVFYDSDEF